VVELVALTTTTVTNVHHGSILPAARIIVIGVPTTFAFLYWFLIVRRRSQSK
jgi:hypothetical protein